MRRFTGVICGLACWLSSAQVLLAGSPEQKLMALRDAAVRNDLPALVKLALPPRVYAEAQADVARKQATELDDSDPQQLVRRRAEFAETFGLLQRPDAASVLMEKLRPQLLEARVAMLAGQLMFFTQAREEIGKNTETPAADRAQQLALLNAVQLYLGRVDVLDEARLTRALNEFSRAARETGIQQFDHLRSLDLEGLLQRFSTFLPASKRAFAAYEIDVNAILRSARFRTMELSPEISVIEVELELLDVPVRFPVTLRAAAGDWYLLSEPQETSEDPVTEVDAETAVQAR